MSASKGSILVKQDVLNPSVRFHALRREGRQLLRSLRQNLNHPQAADTIQHLRDQVVFHPAAKNRGGKTVGLAGPNGGEGSTAISLLLGLTLGELSRHRVIFIDGRLGRRNFSLFYEIFGLTRSPLNYNQACGYFQCYSTPEGNLSFLAPGQTMEALELFSTREIGRLIADLREAFDYIVFDMPPLLAHSETRMVFPHLDLFFLVCAARKTAVPDILRAQRIAAEVGGGIGGVVLNKQKVPFWASFIGKEAFF